jgi:hypothetical protein
MKTLPRAFCRRRLWLLLGVSLLLAQLATAAIAAPRPARQELAEYYRRAGRPDLAAAHERLASSPP